MNPFELYLIKIFILILAIIFLTIVLSYLALLIRFCPKNRRIILVESITDVTVFGPGWVFLKPYRGRVINLDLHIQQCEVKPFPFQRDEKISFSFKIIDAAKATIIANKQAEYVLEEADIPDKQKEAMRYTGEHLLPINRNIRYFARTLVGLTYVHFVKTLEGDNNSISNEALEQCKVKSGNLLIDQGLQLLDMNFSLDGESHR
jgi:hypothetical protein